MRIGNRLPVKLNLDPGGHDNLHIAPLIFICPVENAFKHGNTGMPDAEITISITCSNTIVECLIINHTAGNENNKKFRYRPWQSATPFTADIWRTG